MRTGEKEGRGALRQKNSHKNGKKGLQNGKIFLSNNTVSPSTVARSLRATPFFSGRSPERAAT